MQDSLVDRTYPPSAGSLERYCELKIWPDGNARAWPVERGNVVIH